VVGAYRSADGELFLIGSAADNGVVVRDLASGARGRSRSPARSFCLPAMGRIR
jgi:hypothetical protein